MPLDELVPFIDWTFFFAAWELKGRFPAILDHPQYGAAARELYDNARTLLDRIIREQLLTARGVYGFWPAASRATTSSVSRSSSDRGELLASTCFGSRRAIADGKPNLSLADFVADRQRAGARLHRRVCGHRRTRRRRARARFERDTRRLQRDSREGAGRSAGRSVRDLPPRPRRARTGASARRAATDDILHEKHRGIRPGFGYPACPDHSEKFKLFDLLARAEAGIELTEHAAMTPGGQRQRAVLRASAGAILHCRPRRRGSDRQLRAAQRESIGDTERWLRPQLAYESARC